VVPTERVQCNEPLSDRPVGRRPVRHGQVGRNSRSPQTRTVLQPVLQPTSDSTAGIQCHAELLYYARAERVAHSGPLVSQKKRDVPVLHTGLISCSTGTSRAFAWLGGAKLMSANCFSHVDTYKCSPFGQLLTKLSADFCTRYLSVPLNDPI
jgi:hypothetical protein